LKKVKNAGYDGVEMSLPMDKHKESEIFGLLQTFELEMNGQHRETMTSDYSLHKKEFRERLINLTSVKPIFINTQKG
jgi:hypothetical protein